ncbi:MAG: MBL fold metallo-hydrolase [Acidimicrobiales bacterium]
MSEVTVGGPDDGPPPGVLRLTVCGSSGSYPGPGGACSGYLVQGGATAVVIDLGPGVLANLQRHVPLAALDGGVLTHAHPDHWVDLTGLEVAYTYDLGRSGFPVFGTGETAAKAEVVSGDLAPTLDWHDLADRQRFVIGDLAFETSRTVHYVETYALRITPADAPDGPSLAYSADTGPGWSFAAFGAPIDVALCEATFCADMEPAGIAHLSARQAGTMAADAGVRHLVLTHLFPGVAHQDAAAEGAAAFGRPVHVARDGDVFEVDADGALRVVGVESSGAAG